MQQLVPFGQVGVQVEVHRHGDVARRAHPLPAFPRQQVVLEVAEPVGAADVDVAASQAVLEPREHARLVAGPVDGPVLGEDVRLPPGPHEGRGRPVGHLAPLRRVHPFQYLDRPEQGFRGRGGGEAEGLQEERRVPAQAFVVVFEVLQEVEGLRHGQVLGLRDALDEPFPRHEFLEERVGIRAGLPGRDKRLAHARVEADLLVDLLAPPLEVLVAGPLGARHRLPDHPVVHLQGLVGEGGGPLQQVGDEGGATAACFERREVLRRHARPLGGQAGEAVVVDRTGSLGREPQFFEEPQLLDDLQEVVRRGGAGRLPEPHQLAARGVPGGEEQRVEAFELGHGEVRGQRPGGLLPGPAPRLPREPLRGGDRRRHDAPSAHLLQERLNEGESRVRLRRHARQPPR